MINSYIYAHSMKQLILIRHAESAEKVTGQTDQERELTTSGMRQAASVGRFLSTLAVPIEWLLVSSAKRTVQTARLIAEQLGFEQFEQRMSIEEELYQASLRTMLDLLHQAQPCSSVAIVAHNPTISYFAEFVCNGEVEDLAPAHTIVLKLPIRSWREVEKGSASMVERFEP